MRNNVPLGATGLILGCLLFVCCGSGFVLTYFIIRPPRAVTGQSPIPAVVPGSPTLSSGTAVSCPAAMNKVMQAAQPDGSGLEPDPNGTGTEPVPVTLVTYRVHGDNLTAPRYRTVPRDLMAMQKDADTQASTWKLFETLIPLEYRTMVSEYVVFSDGLGNRLAAVQQSEGDPGLWSLQVDPADAGDRPALVFTLIHEFGHLLTLNASQVPPDREIFAQPDDPRLHKKKVQACSTYFPGEGCSLPGSYINAFYDRFWTSSVAADWQPVDSLSQAGDLEKYYDELYSFYEAHQDQFVDDYAVTNPSEDIAETFTYFIFSGPPAGSTIAEQKILFFQQYPELVVLRREILSALCEVYP